MKTRQKILTDLIVIDRLVLPHSRVIIPWKKEMTWKTAREDIYIILVLIDWLLLNVQLAVFQLYQ